MTAKLVTTKEAKAIFRDTTPPADPAAVAAILPELRSAVAYGYTVFRPILKKALSGKMTEAGLREANKGLDMVWRMK